MPRFFLPSVEGDTLTVTGQDAAHIARALRMRAGDALTVCDGRGLDAQCVIDGLENETVLLRVTARRPSAGEPSLAVTLYQGLPKSDKMEWIIQKAVELGVNRVVPVAMARSVAVVADAAKAAKKAARWQKIADEAAGQCGRGVLPVVEPPLPFAAAAARLAAENTVVCYEGGGEPLSTLVNCGDTALSLVVGPEGGIDPREVERLRNGGAKLATLGPRILRCETAPIAALAVLMAASGNMECV